MTKAVFRRYHNTLQPVGDDARDLLMAIENHRDVMVTVHPARNPKHHRLYWALMRLVHESTDRFDSEEHVSICLKYACHEVDTCVEPDTGEVRYVPRSLKFESMDQARFARFFARALFVVTERWLVGTDMDTLRDEVFALCDGPERASLGRRAA